MKLLSIIAPNISRLFYSPVFPNLVRTGVIADGSCFFHVLCLSLFKEYRDLSIKDRINYVHAIRKQIVDTLTIDDWKALGNGEVYRFEIVNHLRMIVKLNNDKLSHSFKYWDDHILPMISNEWKSTSLNDVVLLLNKHSNVIDHRSLLQQTEQHAYQQFKYHLLHNWVDDVMLNQLSVYFKCNFYFLKASDRHVYKTFNLNKYNKNIVFCWIQEKHYESIGLLFEKNKVQRVFSNNDPFIQIINKQNK